MPAARQIACGKTAWLGQGMENTSPAHHVPEEKTMTRHIDVTEVGAPDPELRNSPIFDDAAEDASSYDFDLEEGVCYFNDVSYRIGEYVCSSAELLHCEERGIWVRKGSCYSK